MPADNRRSVRPHASEESSCLGPGFHPGHSAATHLGDAGVPLPRCATSAPAPNPSPRSPNSSNLPGAAADTAATYGPFWGLHVPALNPGTAMRDVKPGGEEAVAEVTELLHIAPPATPLAGLGQLPKRWAFRVATAWAQRQQPWRRIFGGWQTGQAGWRAMSCSPSWCQPATCAARTAPVRGSISIGASA